MDSVSFTIPLKTSNPQNGPQHKHWGPIASKRKAARKATHYAIANLWRVWKEVKAWPAWHIRIERISPRQLDNHDGLRAAMKSIVDQLVDELGLTSDRDPRLDFVYTQDFGPGRKPAVAVIIDRWSP